CVEGAALESARVVCPFDEPNRKVSRRARRLLDHPGRDVDAGRRPAEPCRVNAELAAAAAEIDERRAFVHRGCDAFDREPHALRPDRELRTARVGALDPRGGVAVEVVLYIVLHGAKLVVWPVMLPGSWVASTKPE